MENKIFYDKCEECNKQAICKYKNMPKEIKHNILQIPYGQGYTYKEANYPVKIQISCEHFESNAKPKMIPLQREN